MKKWLYLALAIGSEVSATLALRAATGHPAWLVLVAVGYTAAFVLMSLLLREGMSIGVAYGIWAATGVVLTALLAIPFFGERLTWAMGLGIVVIVAGVLLVELGSRSAERP
jgi:small multidrug resistance pump